VKSLRDQYRAILRELGVKTADSYRSITLKLKLQQKYGKRISILDQSCGSGFICASTIPLGDALEKLRHREAAQHEDEKHRTLRHAAKILRADCKQCKRQCQNEQSTEISFAAAARLIPDSLFNFTAMLLSETPTKLQESGRVLVNQPTIEKALIASQQLLQHIAGVPTPLAIATAYHVFNQTRSKSLVLLNNRSTMLKLLPPTEHTCLLHLQRAALATIIDKTAHVAKPQLPPFVDYGWALEDGKLVPVLSTQPAWPQTITKAIACGCTKDCNKNCSCARKNVACYIGCRCQGSATKCSRVKYTAAFDSSDSSNSDSDN